MALAQWCVCVSRLKCVLSSPGVSLVKIPSVSTSTHYFSILTQRKHNDFAFFSRHARARTESPGLLHYGMSPGVFPSMWLPSPCYPFLFPFLIPPLSWRPIYRLTLSFLDTLLNMSIVRSSCSSQSHFLWEALLGLAFFPHPYELRLTSPTASWKTHLKHSSWVLLPEGPSFHHGVHSVE